MMNRLFLLLLTLTSFACVSTVETHDTQLLLISFDGFRADYLEKTDTPNFDRLVKQGVRSEGMIPVFPSKTFPNHYAIVTGLYPENNGVVGNNMYDPVMDARYRISNRDAVENPDWYEGEPIWNTAEKQGKRAGTMFWVGSEAPIQNMRPTHWKRYDGSMPSEARIDSVLKWMDHSNPNPIDIGTLYFSFVDDAGHEFGPDSPEVVEAIQQADAVLGYLMEQMRVNGLMGKVNIIIVSDHGMSEVSRERLIIMDDFINIEDVDVISYSPVLGLDPKPGKKEEVYQALKKHEEHFRVYKKEDLPEEYRLKNHRRTSEIVIIADLGYTISDRSYAASRPDYPSGGTHGFDNQEPEMHAVFIAYGPDFKAGYRMGTFENIHLYELMAHLLDIDASVNDGKLEEIREMLK